MSSTRSNIPLIALMVAGASIFGSYLLLKNQKERREEQDGDGHDAEQDEPALALVTQPPASSSKHDLGNSIPRDIQLSSENSVDGTDMSRILQPNTVSIVHASVTGTCATFARDLHQQLLTAIPQATVQLGKVEEWDWWDELLNNETDRATTTGAPPVVVLLIPTHHAGAWPVSALALQTAIQDLQHDWRIEKAPLRTCGILFGVFGMGSSAYGDGTMGQPAKEAMQQMRMLGAKPMGSVGIGDDSVGDLAKTAFVAWKEDIVAQLETMYKPASSCGCAKSEAPAEGGCCQTKEPKEEEEAEYGEDDDEEEEAKGEPELADLEDMGDVMKASGDTSGEPKEMVTPSQAVALKKEGYRLIGTHSAVKLCRWTKHQLRGRGGCYKHTFYGITSYQCMEATPSLACANKCVFCWRHHKNPVGKEWRWKTDDPFEIVDAAVKEHVSMIKETKGIPGVKMDRWRDAHTVRHCALSLVGEPIMYPRIDELLGELHNRAISTFLVTNGQHPAAINQIRPITQLYVSVDAPTQESLIAIDRPLFSDAWDRLKESLACLKSKGQRTVARLTVVKGWNSDEVSGYAKLIALGHVSLVEVKGVTFCGKSDASNLNMSNSPWHHEVAELTKNLQMELAKLRAEGDGSLPEYGLACEHKHSCSVLLARVDQFAVDDPVTGVRKWRTWIDYEKFNALAAQYAKDPTFTFAVEDYTADTPEWALFGANEEGFDPTEQRHRKATKHPKYTKFDSRGVPTHDDNGNELSLEERQLLNKMMDDKKKEIGSGTTVTEMRGGEKQVSDASLMFRGLVIVK
jgi:tRNA wybutosine-synthesizing protein 1